MKKKEHLSRKPSRSLLWQTCRLFTFLLFCLALNTGVAANLLVNPGFEDGPNGWTAVLRGGNFSIVTNAAQAHSGNNYAASTNAGGWSSVAQGSANGGYWAGTGVDVPVSSSKYYQLRAWVRLPEAVAGAQDVVLRYRWQPSGARVDVAQTSIGDANWRLVASEWLQPPVGDNLLGYFEVHTLANGVALHVDDCVLEESDGATITGVIKDNNGNLIEGAAVQLKQGGSVIKTVTSGAGGVYTFGVPPVAGTAYTVNASKLNYTSPANDVNVTTVAVPGVATAPDLVLTALPLVTVSGTVTTSVGGQPVAGAKVTFTSGTDSLTVKTGADGKYSVTVAAGVSYRVTAGRLPLTALFQDIAPNANTTLDFALSSSVAVGLYADKLAQGNVTYWTNQGSLGGRFELLGTAPVATSRGQFKAVFFNNNPMVLKDQGFVVGAPMEITGQAATFTVSAWLLEPDPVLPQEQTYISWAKRGGPDGSNAEMVYGINGVYGAAGHWGGPDLHWGATPPSGGVWHHVVVTFNGTSESSYIDGVLGITETKVLDIATGLPIVLGSGYNYNIDTAAIDPAIQFSGYIAQVEIMTAPADAEDVARLYTNAPPVLPIATLTGKVLAPAGTGVSGVNIQVTDGNGVSQGIGNTDASGNYSIVVPAPGSYTIKATKLGSVVMPAPQSKSVVVGDTAIIPNFTATESTISGVVKDSITGAPIYNAVVQSGEAGGPAVITDATGAYTLPAFGNGGAIIFADALGYRSQSLLVTATGAIKKTLSLVPQVETGVITNGGFEITENGLPTDWTEKWTPAGLVYSVSNNPASGTNSAWVSGTESYSAMAQYVPVTPGYVYNGYFKAVAEAEVNEWFPMFSFRSAAPDDGEIKGWISAEPGLEGWVHNPLKTWKQYLRFQTYSGDAPQPFIRIAPPANAATIAASFCFAALPPAGKGVFVDDVVIDKVPANDPIVTVGADGAGNPSFPASGFSMPGGVPTFVVPTTAGVQYRLVYKDLLTDSTWTPVGSTWTAGTGSDITLTDTTAGGKANRFYRLEVQ